MGGAKNHMLILPDADLEDVANALMGAAYGSAGERCMAISVGVCVGDEVADQLIEILKPRVEALRIGSSLDTGLEMGPLVTKEHREKVISYIQMAQDEGSRLVVDGRDFVGKCSCCRAVFGKNRSAVSIGVIGRKRHAFFERTRSHDLQHRSKYLFLVRLHLGFHLVDQ